LRTKPKRHFPFLSRHPWVHAHALHPSDLPVSSGCPVELHDHDGNWIAHGLVNPSSRLRVRLYSFDQRETVGQELLARRVDSAVQRRRLSGPADPQGGERLIFSESDGLSGLIVDRYADCLSVQLTAAALLPWGEFLVQQTLRAAEAHGTPCSRVVARVDATTAGYEGINETDIALLQSWQQGLEELPEDGLVWYRHNDLEMAVDLQHGQKTGGFLDQRENHAAAARYMPGRRVLDVCTYTGGFALAAARAGAEQVIGIDSSERALQQAARHAERNGLPQFSTHQADCFDDLKARHVRGERFDAIILDPPRFAGSRHQVDAALRAYGRLNTSAVELLHPGGILVTCSCSGRVSRADFLNMLADVGRRCRRDLVLLESRGPSSDHPVAVSCPESNYLKCMILQAP